MSHNPVPVSLIVDLLIGLVVIGVVFVVFAAFLHRGRTRADWGAPGLYGVVGRMGGGKSYFLALAASTCRKQGRAIYANYELEGASRYHSWQELMMVPKKSVILMDEVHLWWPSEAWRCPPEIMAFVSQIRKQGITFFWASQHEEFVAKRLRRLTFGYWKCEHFRRGHRYTLFDGVGYGTAKAQRLARMNVVRSKEVMASYDTLAILDGSVEWGDGQGFENLSIFGKPDPPDTTGTAQRSGRPGARLHPVPRHASGGDPQAS